MLCCVYWQLARHNRHVSVPRIGVRLKCLRTLGRCAHASFAAVADSIGEGLLPRLLWPYDVHFPWRVLYAMFPACYLSGCCVFHALLLQRASPGVELHHQVKLYFCLESPLTRVFLAALQWRHRRRDCRETETSQVQVPSRAQVSN